ncbi:hypothetical protein T08_9369 [Trichinella sp. T8]|nr:hypothetical protein T08_9369 [Trichinella sp. T8]
MHWLTTMDKWQHCNECALVEDTKEAYKKSLLEFDHY